MFDIAVNETYETPVEVEMPTGNGKSIKHSFTAIFARRSQEELDEMNRRLNPGQLREGEELMKDDELLQEVLVGWSGIKKGGVTLEFSPENMTTVLNVFPTRATVVSAYFGSLKTSKRKN